MAQCSVYLCVCAYLFILIKRGTCCCFLVFFLPRQHNARRNWRWKIGRHGPVRCGPFFFWSGWERVVASATQNCINDNPEVSSKFNIVYRGKW